jgi:serine palmitoyltransferase
MTSKKSNLDRCKLPIGIRLFVSAGHTESDISRLSSSLKKVSASVLSDY